MAKPRGLGSSDQPSFADDETRTHRGLDRHLHDVGVSGRGGCREGIGGHRHAHARLRRGREDDRRVLLDVVHETRDEDDGEDHAHDRQTTDDERRDEATLACAALLGDRRRSVGRLTVLGLAILGLAVLLLLIGRLAVLRLLPVLGLPMGGLTVCRVLTVETLPGSRGGHLLGNTLGEHAGRIHGQLLSGVSRRPVAAVVNGPSGVEGGLVEMVGGLRRRVEGWAGRRCSQVSHLLGPCTAVPVALASFWDGVPPCWCAHDFPPLPGTPRAPAPNVARGARA